MGKARSECLNVPQFKKELYKDYPSIDGWIEHWNWVHEAPDLSNAPTDWKDRYKEKLWST